MNFTVTDVFKRSVTIELKNSTSYYSEFPYDVIVNGEKICEDHRNVISVDGLLPDTDYSIEVRSIGNSADAGGSACPVLTFHTQRESVLLDVRKFGAKGDGVSSDTAALQAAIYACPEEGTVRVSKGVYYTAPLFLKSGITLWIDEGAVLLGDTDRTHYPILPGMIPGTDENSEYNFGTWEGNPLDSFAALITAIDIENTDVVGRGVLNGNADHSDWWVNHKAKRGAWRPNTVYLVRCRNIRMQNITVRNSPCWTVHPYYSNDLKFYNLLIQNPPVSPNTDGFDPESCRNVVLLGTRISVGDDCIAIKSGKIYMGTYHFVRTDGMEIRNCLFERGHGSVTIGSEIAGGAQNIHVSQCVFDGTDRGVRLKTRRGRGKNSVITGLVFEKINMKNVPMPVTVNMLYYCDPDGHSDYVQDQNPLPVDERTPMIGTFTVRDTVCENAEACFVCVFGLPEQPLERMELENIEVSFLPEKSRRPQVPVMMDNLDEMSGKSFFLRNVKEVRMQNITVRGAADEAPDCVNVGAQYINSLLYEAGEGNR